eukprot:4620762-Pleurochrysis_carterae.AAC.2
MLLNPRACYLGAARTRHTTHPYTHAYAHAHSSALTHARALVRKRTRAANSRTRTHARLRGRACTRIRACTHAPARTRSWACARAHTKAARSFGRSLCSNYLPKISKRFEKYRNLYLNLAPNAEEMFATIKEALVRRAPRVSKIPMSTRRFLSTELVGGAGASAEGSGVGGASFSLPFAAESSTDSCAVQAFTPTHASLLLSKFRLARLHRDLDRKREAPLSLTRHAPEDGMKICSSVARFRREARLLQGCCVSRCRRYASLRSCVGVLVCARVCACARVRVRVRVCACARVCVSA